MAEFKSSRSEQPKSKISFEVTMDNDEFEIKYKDNPTWAHISRWNCEVVPATFDLLIHRELNTIRRLPKTFADCLNVTLTSIRNRKQCLIFAFGHDTLVDAVDMVNKFVEVKQTILKFIREIYAKVKDISLKFWVGEQNGSSEEQVENAGETRNKSESVLFLAPGKSDGYKSETDWFCKLGQDEFKMDLTSSKATFTRLKNRLEDTFCCILKCVRRGSLILECKHESREDAVKMMKDHAKVKDTILECLHDMDPRVNAIRVDVEYREDHVEIDPPQLPEPGHQAKEYVNKEEEDKIGAELKQQIAFLTKQQTETLEKLNELQQAQMADSRMSRWMKFDARQPSESSGIFTAAETMTDVSEDQFQATEDLSEAGGGYEDGEGVSKPRQKSESVIHLKRQQADLTQELKATTDRMHRLETTQKKGQDVDDLKQHVAYLRETLRRLKELEQERMSESRMSPLVRPQPSDSSGLYLSAPGTEGGYGYEGGVREEQETSGSVTDLRRRQTDIEQELKATTERLHSLEITRTRASSQPSEMEALRPGAAQESELPASSHQSEMGALRPGATQESELPASSHPSEMEALRPGATWESELPASSHPSEMEALRPGPTQESELPATSTPARRDPEADRDLLVASKLGNMEDVLRILEAGRADVNCRDADGWTPLMMAANEGHGNMVKILVSDGADVSLVDGGDNNIIHMASINGDVKMVKFVLSLNKLNVNSRGMGSRTAVMLAAQYGHRDMVEFLVSAGADVSLVDKDGDNILHYACTGGDVETVKCVLSLNVVDINARNNAGLTAADCARRKGHQEVVDLL